MELNNIRNKFLQYAKPYIVRGGWSDEVLNKVVKSTNFNIDEVNILFPNGYKDLIEIYLEEINKKMTIQSNKTEMIRLRTHERIKKLLIIRLNIFHKEKQLISKTFYHLLLPFNYSLSFKNLYKTVDQIWYLAGDNSTDFNFYSKRGILASIYTNVMFHFLNNKNLDDTIIFLDKQIKQVSKITKIKNKFNSAVDILPKFIDLGKKFSIFKQ